MRIIAGQFRRRTLLTNPGLTTRPIIDRAKVMLFDHIRHRMPGAKVLDIYSGTGTLGFESLSRGATSVVFCEQDHRAHELLVKNVEMLKVQAQTLCWRVDCLRCSFKAQGGPWYPYSVIFFDPPYVMIEKDLHPGTLMYRSLDRLTRPELTSDDAMLVVRTPSEAKFVMPLAWETTQVISVASMDIHLMHKRLDLVFNPTTDAAETAETVDDAGIEPTV
jgi:16S rRNA (guanine966-N2)-methyltransferase